MKLSEVHELLVGRTITNIEVALDPSRDAILVHGIELDDGSTLYLNGLDDGGVYLDCLNRGDDNLTDFEPDPHEAAEVEAEEQADWEAEQDAEDEARDNEALKLRATCEANDWRFLGENGIPVCNVCGCYGEYDSNAEPGDEHQIKHIRALADVFERWQRDLFRKQIGPLYDADKMLDAEVIEFHDGDPWPAEDPYARYLQRWFKIRTKEDGPHGYLVGIAKVPWSDDPVYLMAHYLLAGGGSWSRMPLNN